MPVNFYAKVKTALIDDPTYGLLNDHLWRRAMELRLIAYEQDEDGRLPNISRIAWRLRSDESAIHRDLTQLERDGIVSLRDNDDADLEPASWWLNDYKVVSDSDHAAYMREWRARQRLKELKGERIEENRIEANESPSDSHVNHTLTTESSRPAYDLIVLPVDLPGPPEPDYAPEAVADEVRRVEAFSRLERGWLKAVDMSVAELDGWKGRDPVGCKTEWTGPLRKILERCNWSEEGALAQMVATRQRMIADGLSPWKPAAVVRGALIDMARPVKRSAEEQSADNSLRAVEELRRSGFIE